MAVSEYLLRYRQESTEDLVTEKNTLKGQQTIFTQQSMGTKSMTRDLRLLEDKLNAIAYVLAERGYVHPTQASINNPGFGVTDFSQMS